MCYLLIKAPTCLGFTLRLPCLNYSCIAGWGSPLFLGCCLQLLPNATIDFHWQATLKKDAMQLTPPPERCFINPCLKCYRILYLMEQMKESSLAMEANCTACVSNMPFNTLMCLLSCFSTVSSIQPSC